MGHTDCPVINLSIIYERERKDLFAEPYSESWKDKIVQMLLFLDTSLMNIFVNTTQIEPYLFLIKTD